MALGNNSILSLKTSTLEETNGNAFLDLLLKYSGDLFSIISSIMPINSYTNILKKLFPILNSGLPLFQSTAMERKKRESFDSIISQFKSLMENGVRTSVNQLYEDVAENVRQSQRLWLQEQKEALEGKLDLPALKQKVDALKLLIQEEQHILATIAEEKE